MHSSISALIALRYSSPYATPSHELIAFHKTDFGERIPHENVQFHDGSDARRMHNMYSVIYNELVFNILKERFGEHEAVVFARASAAGGQRFPVVRVPV